MKLFGRFDHKRIASTKARRVVALLFCAALIFVHVFSVVAMADGKNSKGKEPKTVRVGWYESAYCGYDSYGRRTGMAYEYQQKISAYTGWEYEYVEKPWPELMEMLAKGEIDLLSDVSYKEDRADKMLFSALPMGTETYYIYVRADNLELSADNIEAFEGKKIAVNKGSIQQDFLREWAKSNNVNYIEIENVSYTADECFAFLEDGIFDAFVLHDAYGKSDTCVPVFRIGTSDYYFAVNKNRPDLLRDLDGALTIIQNDDPFYNQVLYKKYILNINVSAYLDEEELSWLSDHGKIRVGYRDNYLPFCSDKNGELNGALSDYLEMASGSLKNAQIEFEPVPYHSTEDSLKALEKGEVDVVFPISLSPYENEELGIVSTDPIMHTEIYAVVNPASNKDVFHDEGVRAALLAGNINFDSFVKDHYPKWNINHRDNLRECYQMVSLGSADCAMVNSYRITQNDKLRREFNLSVLATGENMDFALAVKKGNTELYSILDKTAQLVDETVVETNLSRYAGNKEKVTLGEYLQDNMITAIAVLAVVTSLVLFLLLQKGKAEKKADARQKLISATELDPLTKLYTRNYFFEYANSLFREKPDEKYDAVVANIEQFHIVNALYGWDFGDKVLGALGEAISIYLNRNGGIACRSQADRFDIYCSHTDDYQALFDWMQNRLNEQFENVNLRLRIGVMPWQKDMEPVELFDQARTACGMIRGVHHSRIMVFNEDMREQEILEQRLLNDLKRAMENREFLVYYQPKYNVRSDEPYIVSAEALIRWKHPELGMISPGSFIYLFEKNCLIGEVDKYVWVEVARQIREWKDKYGVMLPISVNLSRIDIFDPNLEQQIDGIVDEYGIDRQALHLEVTESAYTENTEQVIETVRKLREKGYVIEMDDFGTGYSSLNMLSSMPIDILKLDRSFIQNIEQNGGNEKDIRLVELILDIAQSLKLEVIAEGVENEEQLNFLKSRGCDMIQGFYFSKPLPADEFEAKAFSNKS